MKKILLSLIALVTFFTLASCTLQSGDKLEFTSLPQPVYTKGYKVEQFKSEVKIMVNNAETTLAQAEGLSDVVISGIDLENVGTHTLVVVYKSLSLTYKYEVVDSQSIYKIEENDVDTLKAALAVEGAVIELLGDITTQKRIQFENSVTIYGNGHTITITNDDRGLHICPVQENILKENVKITLHDLNVNATASGNVRALNIARFKNSEFIIDNCNITSNYVAIYIPSGQNLSVTVKNGSSATGTGSLATLATNSKYSFINTTFVGSSNWSGDSNGYGVINIQGDLDNKYTETNSEFEFVNCLFKAEKLGQANFNHLNISYGSSNNVVKFSECNFIYDGLEKPLSKYIAENSVNNKINIDGNEE